MCPEAIRRCSSTIPWNRDGASRSSTRSSSTLCGSAAATRTSAGNTSCTPYRSIRRARTDEPIARPQSRRSCARWRTCPRSPWAKRRHRRAWRADRRHRRRYHRRRRRRRYQRRGHREKPTRPNTPTKMSLLPFFHRKTLRCLSLRFVDYWCDLR